MTGFFDVKHFTLRPILVFAVILCLFGCYVTQIHYLCDHHRVDRSLRLMFSHYFIVIAVNLVTVAFRFLENPDASHLFTAGLMIAALLLFFVAIFSDSIYYHEKYRFEHKDVGMSVGFLLIGAAVMPLVRFTIYGFLIGALIAVCGNYVVLLMKYKGVQAK